MEKTLVKIISKEPGKWFSGSVGEIIECYYEEKMVGFPFSTPVGCYIPIEDFGKSPQRIIENWKVKVIGNSEENETAK